MASQVKIISAFHTFPAFFMIYVAVSVPVFGFAFGVGEAGDTSLAIPVGIFCTFLMPFMILASWMTPPLPDSVTLLVGLVCSSLVWWLVFWKFNWLGIEAQVDDKTDPEQITNP